MTEEKATNQELISKCFYYINGFKRHRALAQIRKQEGKFDKSIYHELKSYQLLDSLELTLRAVQKGVRELGDDD